MAEIAQLGFQETKAVNSRAAATSRASPYLTPQKTCETDSSAVFSMHSYSLYNLSGLGQEYFFFTVYTCAAQTDPLVSNNTVFF